MPDRGVDTDRAVRLVEVDEIELDIEKLVTGGDGIGRYQGHAVFVPRVAPGDRIRARITERRPRYARAEVVAILKPGSDRIEPRCRHFADCGGCDLQHLEDTVQTDLKVAAARETLSRLGGLELPQRQEVIRGDAWGYRLRTQLHIACDEEDMRVGYFARRSHRLVAIRECPILEPGLEAFAVRVGKHLTGSVPKRLDAAVGGDGSLTCAPALSGLPRGEVSMSVGGFVYDFDARIFFQCHRGLIERLSDCVVGEWSGTKAFDLYAGVGLFSLPLARRYDRVVAVEGDRIATRYLKRNARRARLEAIEVVTGSVEDRTEMLTAGVDRVVVNPPRRGLPVRIVGRLLAAAPRRVTYVSCHEAALARDLKRFGARYRVESLAFIDLFPQTGHLETVAQLRHVPG